MAIAATIAPSALKRLYEALGKPNPSYLLISGLERDAKSLLSIQNFSLLSIQNFTAGHLILGMLNAINNQKMEFDEHFNFISAPGKPTMADFPRLNGLNRMGFFNEATEYLKQMLNSAKSIDDPEYLKPLAHFGMTYGFTDDVGSVVERLKCMGTLEPNHQGALEIIYEQLKETNISQAVMIETILAAKKLLAEKGLQIPAYSFGYSVESDIFIELKMLCFGDNIELLAEADESLSLLLVDMEESTDENLINFSISCRPYNLTYGIGN